MKRRLPEVIVIKSSAAEVNAPVNIGDHSTRQIGAAGPPRIRQSAGTAGSCQASGLGRVLRHAAEWLAAP